MSTCPDLVVLKSLLNRELDLAESDSVELHVESCSDCQLVLEGLTDSAVEVASTIRRQETRPADPRRLDPDSPSDEFIERLAERAAIENSNSDFRGDLESLGTSSIRGLSPASSHSLLGLSLGAMPRSRSAVLPKIPGFEILGEIGRGGMSVVYKAIQTRLNRVCALKMILDADRASEDTTLRFLAEAETVARLRNINVVQIFSIGEYDGKPYLELEYLEGGTLRDWIAGEPKHHRIAALMAVKLVEVLVELHRLSIVHRDLKPSNILLTREREPRIADFGLAKVRSSSNDLTRSRTVLGSPAYMAPEQAGAETSEVTPVSDIYSLGVILYEMLVGRPPFQGASVFETLEQVKTTEPVSPSRLVPGIPRDLVTIVLKCLQKSPEKRYETASDLLDDLRRFLEGRPIRGRRTGSIERAWRWSKRYPLVAGAIAVACVSLVLTLGVIIRSNAALRAKQAELNTALRERNAENQRVETLSTELALDRGISLGESGKISEGLLWMADAARRLRPGETELENRLRLNIDAWSRLQPKPIRVFDHAAAISCATTTHDAATLITGGRDGLVRFWDIEQGKPTGKPISFEGPIVKLAVHPNARVLLVARAVGTTPRHDRLAIVSLPDGKVQRDVDLGNSLTDGLCLTPDGQSALVSMHEDHGFVRLISLKDGSRTDRKLEFSEGVGAARFDPSGKYLAIGIHDISIIADARTFKEISRFPTWSSFDFRFSPDGKSVLAGGRSRVARLIDIATGEPRSPELKHADFVVSVALSPDGLYALTGSLDRTARLWDLAAGTQVGATMHHGDAVNFVDFIRDGTAIVTAGDDGTARVWDIREPLGGDDPILPQLGKPRRYKEGESRSPDPTINVLTRSPDGSRFFVGTVRDVGRGDGRLWDAASKRPVGRPLEHAGGLFAARFSPDSRRLVTGGGWYSDLSSGRIWDAKTGKPIGKPFRHAGYIGDVDFSPDGRTALTASYDNSIRFYDVEADAEQIPGEIFEKGMFFSARFGPTGDSILTGHEKGVAQIRDVKTREKVGPELSHAHHVSAAGFSPDGGTLVSASWDGTLRLWDAATGRQIGRPIRKHASGRSTFVFAPDGQSILIGSLLDDTARWFDTRTAKSVGEPLNHSGLVTLVSLSQSGKICLTLTEKGDLRVWDVKSHRPLTPPVSFGVGIGTATFDADDTSIICGCNDGTIRYLSLPRSSGEPSERLASRLERRTGLYLGENNTELPIILGRRAETEARQLELEPLPSPSPAWHEARAALAIARSDWFAADLHQQRLGGTTRDGYRTALRLRVLRALGRSADADKLLRDSTKSVDKDDLIACLEADAQVLELLGEWTEVRWYFERLIELVPDRGEYHARLGRALLMLDLPAEGRSAIDRAVQRGIDPSDLEHLAKMSAAWLHWKSAAPLAVAATKRAKPLSDAWIIAAFAQLTLNDRSGYQTTCEKIVEHLKQVDPNRLPDADINSLLWVLTLAPHEGDLKHAIAIANKLESWRPSISDVIRERRHKTLLALEYRDRRDQDVIDRITRGLPWTRNLSRVECYYLTLAYRRTGRESDANRALKLFREREPARHLISTDWVSLGDSLLRLD